ncbi:unnamed protein product [Schistocephalus solidus]|uniref:Uncharacterized protein n=1 Tax=Schistocephalus solidus TaxID=70667 RepID=A0A183T6M0_SCHSO|nr:unnamed protein product [Schistocephalus solidus]
MSLVGVGILRSGVVPLDEIRLISVGECSPEGGKTSGECSCGRLQLVHNSLLWLLEVGFFPVAIPRATVTTGGLNQVRVTGVVCASTPAGPGSQIAKYVVVKLKQTKIPQSPSPAPYPPGCSDNPRSNRPKRRTVLVARELARNKVDIAGLSETRFSELGQLEEGISDRLMSLRLPLRREQLATIINAYVPPMTSSDAARDTFYEDTHALLVTGLKVDK